MKSDPLTVVRIWDVYRGRLCEEEDVKTQKIGLGTAPSHATPKVDPADSFILDF